MTGMAINIIIITALIIILTIPGTIITILIAHTVRFMEIRNS